MVYTVVAVFLMGIRVVVVKYNGVVVAVVFGRRAWSPGECAARQLEMVAILCRQCH